MTSPLILKGAFYAGPGPAFSDDTDYSDAVTSIILAAKRDEVAIPATLGAGKSTKAGGTEYTVQINYLSNDLAGELFEELYLALLTPTGELHFAAVMTDDVVSADNPMWSGTMIVTAVGIGGDAEGLSTDSVTFTLTDVPDMAVA